MNWNTLTPRKRVPEIVYRQPGVCRLFLTRQNTSILRVVTEGVFLAVRKDIVDSFNYWSCVYAQESHPWKWLTLPVAKPEYSQRSGPIPWLLMPQLPASPGHQEPWCWRCNINRLLTSTWKYWNYMLRVSVEKSPPPPPPPPKKKKKK